MTVVRNLEPGDFAFVMDSWLKGWRSSPWAGVVPNNQYGDVQRSVVEGLVGRGAKFRVLADAEDPTRIKAWVCSEVERTGKTVVHFLHTRSQTSQDDLQRLLSETEGSKPGFYTHRTTAILEALGKSWVHAPEIARRK